MDKSKIKSYLFLITCSLLIYFGLQNLVTIKNTIGFILNVIQPIVYGCIFAFILNGPYEFFENKVFGRLGKSQKKMVRKCQKPLSLFVTYGVVIVVIFAIFSVLIPQLIDSVVTFSNNIYGYYGDIVRWVNGWVAKLELDSSFWDTVMGYWNDFISKLSSTLTSLLPSLFNYTKSITTAVTNLLLGIMVSIYIILSKDNLLSQVKRMLHAFAPKKVEYRLGRLGSMCNKIFSGFIYGQVLAAIVAGFNVFLGMTLLRLDYALLIGVIYGVFGLIPFFGCFIGTFMGAFILFMVSPMKALWFIIFIIIYQQIDGNIISPHIVGDQVGLPTLWVLFSILLGGGLFGFAGILFGVPTFAVIYALIKEETRIRLEEVEAEEAAGETGE